MRVSVYKPFCKAYGFHKLKNALLNFFFACEHFTDLYGFSYYFAY